MKHLRIVITMFVLILCSCGAPDTPGATLVPGGPTATAAVATRTPLSTATIVPATETPETVSGSVTAESLNVRSGPGTTYPVIGGLSLGDEVEVVGKNDTGSWLQITYEGGRGWVFATYIDTEE